MCLPAGEGRDEGEETKPIIDVAGPKSSALSATVAAIPTVDKASIVKESTALAEAVAGVIITDQDTYTAADTVLSRVQTARKVWNQKMYGTKERPGPIPQIRSGLDQLYALNREVDQPLEKLEETIKKAMKDFKMAELVAARELQAAKDAEQARLAALAREAEEKAAAARTKQMRDRLEQQRQEILQQQEEIAAVEAPATVVGNRSSDRKVMKWRLSESDDALLELLMGVIEGTVEREAVSLNTVHINKRYKENPALVRSWPGVEEFEDVQIVGR